MSMFDKFDKERDIEEAKHQFILCYGGKDANGKERIETLISIFEGGDVLVTGYYDDECKKIEYEKMYEDGKLVRVKKYKKSRLRKECGNGESETRYFHSKDGKLITETRKFGKKGYDKITRLEDGVLRGDKQNG